MKGRLVNLSLPDLPTLMVVQVTSHVNLRSLLLLTVNRNFRNTKTLSDTRHTIMSAR